VSVTVSGWLCAAVAIGAAALLRRELDRRGELVARACHELRGPLTAARLGLQLVARPGAGPARSRLDAIDGELRRAGLALDDLDAARAGRRARERRDLVDVGSLLREAAEAWRPVADASGKPLRLDAPAAGAVVRGDRLRLAQACGNLLRNAIEHGAGTVQVRGRVGAGAVRIEVCDEGQGLPAPVGELVRRRGSREDRGRGLAIAADVAARHGGRLAAAPAPRGARLALELPLAGIPRLARA
jgi:signal transduction histidine kinase